MHRVYLMIEISHLLHWMDDYKLKNKRRLVLE